MDKIIALKTKYHSAVDFAFRVILVHCNFIPFASSSRGGTQFRALGNSKGWMTLAIDNFNLLTTKKDA